MNDLTFLRNLARRGRVVLLADGSAVPVPLSVVDDESRAGGTFRINLISPEEIESGDRRTFAEGTVEHRALPIPLLWQWQLQDGHKTAVVVGRIDYLEQTPQGLGNARGVFDSGPWGREAERMVRARMLRGVSGDYSNFDAQVLEKVEPEDDRLLDDKIRVQKSQLVAATIVAKPAFEGCCIEMTDEPADDEIDRDPDDFDYPDGVIEAQVPITASALIASGRANLVIRLERLERLETLYQTEALTLTASAAKERVARHRLDIEREEAIARMSVHRNVTAAWKPLSHAFLSAKAKAQPRDKMGRWIEMGSMVRWVMGTQIGGHKDAPGEGAAGRGKYMTGRVIGFNPTTKKFTVKPTDDDNEIALEGKDLEVVRAVIPDSPEQAKRIAADMPRHNTTVSDQKERVPEGYTHVSELRKGDFVKRPGPTGATSYDKRAMRVGEVKELPQDKDGSRRWQLLLRDAGDIDAREQQFELGESTGFAVKKVTPDQLPDRLKDENGEPIKPLPAVEPPSISPTRVADLKEGDWIDIGSKNSPRYQMVKSVQREPDGSWSVTSKDAGDFDSMPDKTRFGKGDDAQARKIDDPLDYLSGDRLRSWYEPDGRYASQQEDAPSPDNEEPERIPAVEDFRKFMDDEELLDAAASDVLNNYLDEIEIGETGPEQFDAIREHLADHSEYMNDQQRDQVSDALDRMRNAILDAPGDTTIEDLEKPEPVKRTTDDVPDVNDPNPLTVPDDLETPSSPEEQLKKLVDSVGDDVKKEFDARKKAVDEALDKITERMTDEPAPPWNEGFESGPGDTRDIPDQETIASRLISEFDESQRRGADWAVPKDPGTPGQTDLEEASELEQLLRTKGIDAVAFELFKRYSRDQEGGNAWLSAWTQNQWRQIAENIFKKGD